jgi:hypothetical protein
MRLTWKDAVATVLTGSIVTLYIAYLEGAALPLVAGPRVLAAVALVVGLAGCAVGGTGMTTDRPANWAVRVAALLGAVAFIVGLIAMITGSHAMLATLIGVIVTLWLLATARHASTRTPRGRVDDDLRRLETH